MEELKIRFPLRTQVPESSERRLGLEYPGHIEYNKEGNESNQRALARETRAMTQLNLIMLLW